MSMFWILIRLNLYLLVLQGWCGLEVHVCPVATWTCQKRLLNLINPTHFLVDISAFPEELIWCFLHLDVMLEPCSTPGTLGRNSSTILKSSKSIANRRWNEDGTLEILGRLDNQVKVQVLNNNYKMKSILIVGTGFSCRAGWGRSRYGSECLTSIFCSRLIISRRLSQAFDQLLLFWSIVNFGDLSLQLSPGQKISRPRYPKSSLRMLCRPRFYTWMTFQRQRESLLLDCFVEPWIYCSNGKTDKRKLQQLAIEFLHAQSDSGILEVPPRKKSSISTASAPSELRSPQPAYVWDRELKRNSQVSLSAIKAGTDRFSTTKEELAWTGYEDDVIPTQKQGRRIRHLRHKFFTLYRRLFGIVFTINMAIFIWLCSASADAQRIGEIIIVNFFCAILIRQDYVINAIFNTCCVIPRS